MLSRRSVLAEQPRQVRLKFRQTIIDQSPEDSRIDTTIGVSQDVTCADDLRPGDIGGASADVVRHGSGSFADYFDAAGNSMDSFKVRGESGFIHP